MKHEALVLIGGRVAARIGQRADGVYSLRYEDAWRDAADAFPLSLSLPLGPREHGDARVRAYLANLLPDSDAILNVWARRYHVSASNPLALLTHVGEECPGALQIVPPERAEELANGDGSTDEVEWLTEADVAERLARVRVEPAAGREPGDPGQFSLAGAQPKVALLFDGGRWGVPSGRTPTTHILKPPAQRTLDGLAENEHVCLRLAAALRLPAARSQVLRFGGQTAIVVERYDRARTGGSLIRLHQEDFCQALGVAPQDKYEADGGPCAADIINLVQQRSVDPDADAAAMVGALALNWAIGGTDAHAKNYSHLMQPGGLIRLAPLYDIISLLPYAESRGPRVKLAMKIGGEYRMRFIGGRNWERLAAATGIDPDEMMSLVREVVELVPEVLSDVRAAEEKRGVASPVLARMQDEVASHSASCLARLLESSRGD